MGPSVSVQKNRVEIAQSIKNEINQSYSASCQANCFQAIEDLNITLLNANIGGDISIVQACEANASCAMISVLDSQVTSVIEAITKQANKDSGGGLPSLLSVKNQDNASSIRGEILNRINQTAEQSCVSNANQVISGTTILAQNSNIGGSIRIEQKASSVANCVMSNTVKSLAASKARATADQTNSITSIFGPILLIIFVVIIGGGAFAAFRMLSKKKR